MKRGSVSQGHCVVKYGAGEVTRRIAMVKCSKALLSSGKVRYRNAWAKLCLVQHRRGEAKYRAVEVTWRVVS